MENEEKKEFKDVFKKLRESKHISQAKLAEDLNMSAGIIGMYETGKRKPSYETLEQIADYFNVEIDYLTGRESVNIAIINEDMVPSIVALQDNVENANALIKAFAQLTDKEQTLVIHFAEGLVQLHNTKEG